MGQYKGENYKMRKVGFSLLIVGISIIGFYYIYNFTKEKMDENKVEEYFEIEESNDIEEEITDNEIINENIETIKSDTNQYTAVLEIPKINLKNGVINSSKNFDSILKAISVDRNSIYPDKIGNFILYAHSGRGPLAFFKNLNKVNINDDVYVYYNGIKYHYVIYKKYDIQKSGKAKIKAGGENKYITLITCNQSRKGYQTVIIGKIV